MLGKPRGGAGEGWEPSLPINRATDQPTTRHSNPVITPCPGVGRAGEEGRREDNTQERTKPIGKQ